MSTTRYVDSSYASVADDGGSRTLNLGGNAIENKEAPNVL